MKSYAVVGYSGGKAKGLADVAIHFAVDDMQIAEDAQLITGHMIMQWMAQRLREQESTPAAARG
jgi:D-sedoheptulose 7-phosphate isomerase